MSAILHPDKPVEILIVANVGYNTRQRAKDAMFDYHGVEKVWAKRIRMADLYDELMRAQQGGYTFYTEHKDVALATLLVDGINEANNETARDYGIKRSNVLNSHFVTVVAALKDYAFGLLQQANFCPAFAGAATKPSAANMRRASAASYRPNTRI